MPMFHKTMDNQIAFNKAADKLINHVEVHAKTLREHALTKEEVLKICYNILAERLGLQEDLNE